MAAGTKGRFGGGGWYSDGERSRRQTRRSDNTIRRFAVFWLGNFEVAMNAVLGKIDDKRSSLEDNALSK